MLSPASLTLAVERPTSGLTAEGKMRAARMPPRVSVRAYAATFTPDLLAGKTTVRATVEIALANGTRRIQRGALLCVDPHCGQYIPRAG
jgi:hypothetical protein